MKIRLIIWCIGCLAISVLLFSELWAKLPQWFSVEGLQRQGVFHWGVLGLCILWLWLKRKDILPRMQAQKFSLPFIIAGVALVALSIFLPRSDDFLLFLMLMGWLVRSKWISDPAPIFSKNRQVVEQYMISKEM